jgi:acetyl esterase/lipase
MKSRESQGGSSPTFYVSLHQYISFAPEFSDLVFSLNRGCLTAVMLSASIAFATTLIAGERTVEELWPNGAMGAKGNKPGDKPTLTIFKPDRANANGAAVVVCPGGGYWGLAADHEGRQIGEWFKSFGVAAFMLEYRRRENGYGHPAPMQDAQRAIRTIRARAAEWKVDPHRIGIIGFSAGGHLASTAATHFDDGNPNAANPIERASCRPDFLILCYAAITLNEPYSHRGTRDNLLGSGANPALVDSLSNEKQVTSKTPPTFIFQTDEDTCVPAENSVLFYLALRRAHVPAEMHVFRSGGHGLGLAKGQPGTSAWSDCLKMWLETQGFLSETEKRPQLGTPQ